MAWAPQTAPTAPTEPPMPRGLTARIALAFAGVAIVTWLAIGGTLFIILRGLHAQTTGGRLEDQATALAVQARQAVPAGDTATVLSTIRTSLADADLFAYVVTVDGRIVGLDAAPAAPAGTFVIDPGGRSATNHGIATLPRRQDVRVWRHRPPPERRRRRAVARHRHDGPLGPRRDGATCSRRSRPSSS